MFPFTLISLLYFIFFAFMFLFSKHFFIPVEHLEFSASKLICKNDWIKADQEKKVDVLLPNFLFYRQDLVTLAQLWRQKLYVKLKCMGQLSIRWQIYNKNAEKEKNQGACRNEAVKVQTSAQMKFCGKGLRELCINKCLPTSMNWGKKLKDRVGKNFSPTV